MPLDPGSVPPPPRQPSERVLRLAGRNLSGCGLVIVGGVFTSVGLLLLLIFGWTLPGELLLDFTGVPVGGTVESQKVDWSYKVNGRPATRVIVRYEMHHEKHTAEAITIDDAFIARAQPGATVDVEVAPSSPDVARLAGRGYGFFGYFGLFLLPLPLGGLAVLGIALRRRARTRRVLRDGEATVAHVTFSGLDGSIRSMGRNPAKIRWEFERDGRTYTGSISSFAPEMAQLTSSQQVLVVFDRDDPSNNMVWVE